MGLTTPSSEIITFKISKLSWNFNKPCLSISIKTDIGVYLTFHYLRMIIAAREDEGEYPVGCRFRVSEWTREK